MLSSNCIRLVARYRLWNILCVPITPKCFAFASNLTITQQTELLSSPLLPAESNEDNDHQRLRNASKVNQFLGRGTSGILILLQLTLKPIVHVLGTPENPPLGPGWEWWVLSTTLDPLIGERYVPSPPVGA